MFAKWAGLLATALLFVGCASSSTGASTGTPAIALALSPASASVQQGGSTQVGATLTRTNFTAAVTVVVEGAPTGVTGTVVLSGSGATVTLNAASTTAIGQYTVTVRASASGVIDVTRTFALTVTAPGSSYFTLGVNPSTLSINSGSSGTATISIGRFAFAGSVTFSIDGAPAYMSASAPATSGSSATLTVSTTSAIASGSYYLTITGSAPGQTNVVVQLYVTVQ